MLLTPMPQSPVTPRPGEGEAVPSYEQAPNDPGAIAYRIIQKDDTFELRCDTNGEHLSFTSHPLSTSPSYPSTTRVKRDDPSDLEIMRHNEDGLPPASLARISSITRKRINLKRAVPKVKMSSRHGNVALRLFPGNYCGFAHPTEEIEYYWQLRKNDARSTRFKDAVFRRTVAGEKSTITGMYLPTGTKPTVAVEGVVGMTALGVEDEMAQTTPAYDHQVGRLLVRNDLQDFDMDLTLISFIAVLIRVIEAEVSVAQSPTVL